MVDLPDLRPCPKCRSAGKLEEAGSLLQLRVTLESAPNKLEDLSYWRDIRHFGRLLWGISVFDAKPFELILDWLVAEHGKGIDFPAEFTPRREVAALLRAAVEAKRRDQGPPPAVTPKHGEGNGGTDAPPKKPRSTKPADSTPSRGRPVDKATIDGLSLQSRCMKRAKRGRKSTPHILRSTPRMLMLHPIPCGLPSNANTPNRNKSGFHASVESDGNRKLSFPQFRKCRNEHDLCSGRHSGFPKECDGIRDLFSSVVLAFRCNALPVNHLRLSGFLH